MCSESFGKGDDNIVGEVVQVSLFVCRGVHM